MPKPGFKFQRDVFAKPKKKRFKFKKTLVYILLAIFLMASLFVYLLEVNTIAAKGFKVRDLETQIQELTDKNEKLGLQVIDMQSTGALNEKIEELGMEAIDEITYYDVAGQVVARK